MILNKLGIEAVSDASRRHTCRPQPLRQLHKAPAPRARGIRRNTAALSQPRRRMAEITACKENMSEQKADGSPAKKKIRTLDDAPNESHEKKGAAQLAKEKRDQEYKNWVVAAPQLYDVCMQKHLRWPSLTV